MKSNTDFESAYRDVDFYERGIRAVRLDESSLSRVWQHIENTDKPFAVISASRTNYSHAENLKRHETLKKDDRDMGHGFIELEGAYKGATEPSLFVPEISRENAIKLGSKYEQDSVIHKNEKNEFHEVGTNSDTGVGTTLTKFKGGSGKDNLELASGMMKDFYSKLVKGGDREKKFLFKLAEVHEWRMPVGASDSHGAFGTKRGIRVIYESEI